MNIHLTSEGKQHIQNLKNHEKNYKKDLFALPTLLCQQIRMKLRKSCMKIMRISCTFPNFITEIIFLSYNFILLFCKFKKKQFKQNKTKNHVTKLPGVSQRIFPFIPQNYNTIFIRQSKMLTCTWGDKGEKNLQKGLFLVPNEKYYITENKFKG